MTQFTNKNGYVVLYDETIKVGDIISAYLAGYHKVTKIEERGDQAPLIYYVRIANQHGMPTKSKENACDAAFCRHAVETLEGEITKRSKELEGLRNFYVSLRNGTFLQNL